MSNNNNQIREPKKDNESIYAVGLSFYCKYPIAKKVIVDNKKDDKNGKVEL